MPRRTLLRTLLSLGLAAGVSGVPLRALARDIAATVLGRTIYRDELRAPGDLAPLIVRPLLQRYAAEQGLAASAEEVDELLSALQLPAPPPGLTAAERAELRRIPEGMVLDWKIGRALYRRYGGVVIFQQANPLEPVGAMRQFLEEREQAGAFAIPDAADRERFYAYYRRTHPFVVPASEVDFDKPWWRR